MKFLKNVYYYFFPKEVIDDYKYKIDYTIVRGCIISQINMSDEPIHSTNLVSKCKFYLHPCVSRKVISRQIAYLVKKEIIKQINYKNKIAYTL